MQLAEENSKNNQLQYCQMYKGHNIVEVVLT